MKEEMKSSNDTELVDSVASVSSLSDLNGDVVPETDPFLKSRTNVKWTCAEKAALAKDDNEGQTPAKSKTISNPKGSSGWDDESTSTATGLVLRLEWPITVNELKNFKRVPFDQQNTNRKIYTGKNLIFDSHCHLDRVFKILFTQNSFDFYTEKKAPAIKKFSSTSSKSKAAGGPLTVLRTKYKCVYDENFEGCINIICHPNHFAKHNWEWMTDDPGLYFAIGCHPQNASSFDSCSEFELEKAMKHPKVVAVGECGLDDKWAAFDDNIFACQQEVFKRHLKVAMKMKKPLVLHIRGLNAAHAALNLMDHVNLPPDWPIHMHAFTDTWPECQEWAKKWPGMKFGLCADSFDHQIAQNLSLDKILLETDAPYFLPKILKQTLTSAEASSKPVSMPGDVWFVAQQVAYWKNLNVDQILEANRQNVSNIYGIPPYSPFPPGLKVVNEIDDFDDDDHRIYTCTGSFAVSRG